MSWLGLCLAASGAGSLIFTDDIKFRSLQRNACSLNGRREPTEHAGDFLKRRLKGL